PLARQESNTFDSSVDELRAGPPPCVDGVGKSHFFRIAGVPTIFGEAHLLHRTVACEGGEGGTAGRRSCCHDFFSWIDFYGVFINSRISTAISSGAVSREEWPASCGSASNLLARLAFPHFPTHSNGSACVLG